MNIAVNLFSHYHRHDMSLLISTIDNFRADEETYYYWELFDLYREWAVHEWDEVLDERAVDHSISHSTRMVEITDKILSVYDPKTLVEKFSPKYLVLLAISIYTHDIGMQNYFHHRFPSLEKPNYDLDAYDYEIIRQIHADTIEEVYQGLAKDHRHIKYLKQKLSKLHNKNRVLFIRLKNLIKETAIELSLITSFHNKPHSLGELNLSINKLISEEKKLRLSELDTARLKCCVGLLQMADALDMSKNRILINNFINTLEDYPNKDIESIDIISLEKKINCYLIDEIDFNHTNNELLIRIKSSYSSTKYNVHNELLKKIFKKYNDRLAKSENDAVSITRSLLDFNISIDIPPVEPLSSKDSIPDDLVSFLTSLKPEHTDFVSILEQGMRNLIPYSYPSYSKLYSRKLDIFFGGASCNYDNNAKSFIDSLFFKNTDWNIDLSTEPYPVESTRKFLKKARLSTVKAYKRYLSLNKYIKSEVFIPIYHRNCMIAFVNCHFNYQEKANNLVKFGKEIQDSINKTIAPQLILKHKKDSRKYFAAIESIPFLNKSEKDYMLSLYRAIFDQSVNMKVDCISSTVMTDKLNQLYSKYAIRCEPYVDNCTPRYLYINHKLLIKVLNIVTEELAKIFRISICTQCNTKDIYYLIDYTFIDHIHFGGTVINSIIEYLNSNNLLPTNTLQKTFNYPLVIKFLVNLFGGTISMYPIDNEHHLLIHLPTYANPIS